MNHLKSSLILSSIFFTLIFASCRNPLNDQRVETGIKGNISIGIDESLQPVMEQQLKVWDSSYPEGVIHPVFQSEQDNFDLLAKDSLRLIITTRDYTEEEKKWYASKKRVLQSKSLAKDAIAIIIHPDAPDSLMTLGILGEILKGNFPRKYTIVFDNPKSSMVQIVVDSLIKDPQLLTEVYSANSNQAVIDYVAKNPKALGIVGVNHLYDSQDKTGLGKFIDKVKVVSLKNEETQKFYQPFQYNIALNYYPLTRTVYFITYETWQGLGTGFANFLSQEPGQLIFLKAKMAPLRVALEVRAVEIK